MPERYVAIAEEASYAPTSPVTPNKFFAAISCETTPNPGLRFPVSMRGRSVYEHRAGLFEETGTVVMDVKPENCIGWFLKWALGSVSSQQQGATTAYKHTFKSAETIRSFALGYNLDSINEKRLPGCIVNTLDFEMVKGASLMATIGFIAQKEKLVSVQSPTWEGEDLDAFEAYQSKVEVADTELANLVEAFRIHIENRVYGVGDIGVLGSRYLPRIELAERIVTGSIEMPLLSGTIDVYKRFLKDTGATEPGEPVVPFKVELLTDTAITIADTYTYKLDFRLPKCVLTAAPLRIERQERKVFRVDFQAKHDSTDASEIVAELTNTDTGYPDAA